MASADETMTHVGGRVKSSLRWPDTMSASAMIPIVFCASLVPWVNATKLPDTICPRRKKRFTRLGDRRLMTQMMAIISAKATAKPTIGDRIPGMTTLSQMPFQLMTSSPDAAIADPATPPISAWLELDGRPRNQVMRFHVIAPTRPARMTLSVIASAFTIPVAIVAATAKETNAPAKLRIAAMRTAVRGVSALVETLVAMAFAVSWKPFVKSKKRATAMTAARVRSSTPPRLVLDEDVRDHVRGRLTGVESALERLVDVLPADDDERVDPLVPEERGQRVAQDAVALVLVRLDLDESLLNAAHPLQVLAAVASCSQARTMIPHCSTAWRVGISTPYSPSRSDASSR